MKKVSDVFKSIRFAKGEPRGKPHSSTDDEEHGAVGEKEFNQQLQHVKKRAMQEEKKDKYDEGEYDQEGDMAKSDLRSIIANAQKLHDMIDDADNLPEWVQSKITVAEDYISTVANYMTAEMTEEVEQIDEANKPTNPDLWARAKSLARQKFDVYPSAYANGWAAKWYKSKGGGWRSVSEAKEEPPFEPDKPKKKSAVAGKHGAGYSTARHLARMAMKKQSEKMKPMKETIEESRKAEIVKEIVKKKKSETKDKFEANPTMTSEIMKEDK